MQENTRISELVKLLAKMETDGCSLGEVITAIRAGNSMTAQAEVKDHCRDLSHDIYEVLKELGMPANLLGYTYCRRAIELFFELQKNSVGNLTNKIYPEVAKENNTSSSRVERSIRHAIEVCFSRTDVSILEKYFGYTVSTSKGKLSNKEFIAAVVEYVKLHQ